MIYSTWIALDGVKTGAGRTISSINATLLRGTDRDCPSYVDVELSAREVRETRQKLRGEVRRAASSMQAKDCGRIDALRITRQIGDEYVNIRRCRDLRRFADGLKQKLADLARVTMAIAAPSNNYPLARFLLIVAMVVTSTFIRLVGLVDTGNIQAMMMPMRHERVQTFAQERNARIGSKQPASQKFAETKTHTMAIAPHSWNNRTIVGLVTTLGKSKSPTIAIHGNAGRFEKRFPVIGEPTIIAIGSSETQFSHDSPYSNAQDQR